MIGARDPDTNLYLVDGADYCNRRMSLNTRRKSGRFAGSGDGGVRGVLIAVEGIDGSGKTLQSKMLVRWLRGGGFRARYTREPTGGQIGRILKRMLGRTGVDARVEALLFAADRLEHLNRVILPSLREGFIVVSDRYVYSSLAYQSVSTGEPGWVREINRFAPKPDLTILLDVDPVIGLSRIGGRRRSRFEERGFLERVREEYLKMSSEEGFVVIDASKSISEVSENIRRLVGSFLSIR